MVARTCLFNPFLTKEMLSEFHSLDTSKISNSNLFVSNNALSQVFFPVIRGNDNEKQEFVIGSIFVIKINSFNVI